MRNSSFSSPRCSSWLRCRDSCQVNKSKGNKCAGCVFICCYVYLFFHTKPLEHAKHSKINQQVYFFLLVTWHLLKLQLVKLSNCDHLNPVSVYFHKFCSHSSSVTSSSWSGSWWIWIGSSEHLVWVGIHPVWGASPPQGAHSHTYPHLRTV